ncbi:MAG: hypothetical protein ACYSW3_20130 [Planctomycetota bacterium]
MNIESFKEAFHTGYGGCRRECDCGVQFYNSCGDWDWEDGELEALHDDEESRDIDCTVSQVEFFGTDYVYQCDCWHDKAKRFMQVVDNHSHGIAQYLKLEKIRMQSEVDQMPTVE